MLRCPTPVIAVAAVLTTFACGGSTPGPEGISPEGVETLTVEVINRNFYDATIYYVYTSTGRQRLGLVGGNTTRTFTIPWNAGELRMIMNFIGANASLTEELSADPGDELLLEILPQAHLRSGRIP
jgi:hypothetical protein